MVSTARAALVAAVIGLVPAVARAQAPTTTTEPAGAVPQPAPAPGDTGAAPAPSGSAKPVVPATGYGWSTTPKKRVTRPRVRAARTTSQAPDAILPGFETLGDGSTRLFVILTKPVQYEARPAHGTITYVLKGAYVDKRNNFNPLVTVHFNTPVTSARLVPHGSDLWFVVDLRADVTPQVTMDNTKEGGAMLRIDFPKGDYLPGAAAPSPPAAPAPSGPAAPAPNTAPAATPTPTPAR